MYSSVILSAACYVPEEVRTNADLEKVVRNYDAEISGVSLDEWVFNHYGIKQRHWSKSERPSEQATKAAKLALKRANLSSKDVDFIILNTVFGDYSQPTTATAVQRNLGMRQGTFALEINMPCSGPIYGMVLANNFISTGQYKTGLVIGVDKMSDLVDQTDFKMGTLFGDGAGACVLSRSINESGGIKNFYLASSGENVDEDDYVLRIPGGKAVNPTSHETVDKQMHFLKMNGKKSVIFIEECIASSIGNVLDQSNLKPENIKYVVPHQASKKQVLKGTRRAGIKDEKVLFSLEEKGNTSSASILVTLDKLFRSNTLERGDHIILTGMGGGLNWGALLYEWVID